MGTGVDVINSTWESLAAVALFLLTPRSLILTLAKYVPGTQENLKSQQDYAKRVRDVTAGRVEQFSEVFRQLARSFKQLTTDDAVSRKEEEVGHFMNAVAQKACDSCWKKSQCWDQKFYQTYTYMTDMMTQIEMKESMTKKNIPPEWRKVCIRTDQVLDVMKQQYELI